MKGPERRPLEREALLDEPAAQFRAWFDEVRREGGLDLPDAACLSTVGPDGRPEGRMVLVKDVSPAGFVFYTNLASRKAEALRERPRAALTFYWETVRRQVRIEGDVVPVEPAEADAYFAGRPRRSRIAAWASRQSDPIDDREALERDFRRVEERFSGSDEVPRPPFWSGFRVRHRSVEFWQEGPDRLHDRFRYDRADDGWEVVRLYP